MAIPHLRSLFSSSVKFSFQKGSVYMEFGITAILLVLALLLILLTSLLFLNFSNSYFVAKNIYTVIKNANLDLMPPENQSTSSRMFTLRTPCSPDISCIDCSRLPETATFEQNLCLARLTSMRFFKILTPSTVTVYSKKVNLNTSSQQGSNARFEGLLVTVNVRFIFDLGFFELLNQHINNAPFGINISITGLSVT
ncbi:MAG: hypothetical protein NZO16_07505 [Deltaproteobacteria bacterium]|nr:hypothetical protein [Deltaproteobacteria bacterium]